MLSLKNYANPSTNILFIIITKYVILDNLLHTTKIAYLLSTSLLVSSFYLLFSDISHIYLYTLPNPLLLLATSNSLLPTLSSFIYLYA